MKAEIDEFASWVENFLEKLSPEERKKVLKSAARLLRERNQERITAQVAPDGTPFEPRKVPQRKTGRVRRRRGSIRRKNKPKAMFRKLRLAKWIKATAWAEGAEVGWTGEAGRVARIHNYGYSGRDKGPDGKKLGRIPARPLLGVTDEDEAALMDLFLEAMTKD